MRKFLYILLIPVLALIACTGKTYDEMTPEEQAKEYVKFQKDSLKVCTQDTRLAQELAIAAFGRATNFSSAYKKHDIKTVYNDSLKCYVTTIPYRMSSGNYYADTKVIFDTRMWYVTKTGLAKDGEVFYTIKKSGGVLE